MTFEEQFLTEITSNLDNRGTRFVYADWLEEQGDVRGELIRVEEEMRSISIYSDRYWQLKLRRNELRKQCPSQWLEQLKYGTDYEPVFREVPDGWKERWRLLREFTERWYGIPMGDVGEARDAVSEVEERLNLKLPLSIQEWIAFYSDLGPSNICELFWAAPGMFRVDTLPGVSAVSIVFGTDYCVDAAVRIENFQYMDPPVNGYEEEEYQLADIGTVSPRVTTMIFDYLHGVNPRKPNFVGCLTANAERSPKLLQELSEAFPVQSQFDGILVFEDRNLSVLHFPGSLNYCWSPTLRVSARKNLTPEQVPEFLWDYVHPQGNNARGIFVPSQVRTAQNNGNNFPTWTDGNIPF